MWEYEAFFAALTSAFAFLLGYFTGWHRGMRRATEIYKALDDMVALPSARTAVWSERFADPPPSSHRVPAGLVRIEDDSDEPTLPGFQSLRK